MVMRDWPEEPVESVKRSVELAEILGAKTVVVHPPERWVRFQAAVTAPRRAWKLTLPLPLARPGRLGRWLRDELPDFQATTQVKICLENMPCRRLGPFTLEPHHFYQPARLRQFQYLTLDTTHVGTRRIDLLAFYRQIAPRVAHLHLSNFDGQEHRRLDQGCLPLAELLQQLARRGYQGLVSVEISPFSLQVEQPEALRQHLADSLAFCRRALTPEPVL